MIKADARNREVLFPYMIGRDLIEEYYPTRWIIDFAKRDLFEAKSYALPFATCRKVRNADRARARRTRAESAAQSGDAVYENRSTLVAILRLSTGDDRRD